MESIIMVARSPL